MKVRNKTNYFLFVKVFERQGEGECERKTNNITKTIVESKINIGECKQMAGRRMPNYICNWLVARAHINWIAFRFQNKWDLK